MVPLLATQVFGLQALTGALSFIVVFGLAKAATNYVAGVLADRYGRKPVLVAGWLIGMPVPILLIVAPSWAWVLVANALLGINQGLTWSMTVTMKIDLVGPRRRGFALGLNEAAGYGAVGLTAFVTGIMAERWGLRPAPFLLGLAFAGLGLGLSTLFVRETHGHARFEAVAGSIHADSRARFTARDVFILTSARDRALSAASQAGLVNNLNDGLAWGLLPIYYASAGLSLAEIGVLAAIYPTVWGIGQLGMGALSDRIGRKGLIAAGMLLQAGALVVLGVERGFGPWAAAGVGLGIGTAMVYPTLLAVIGDAAHPAWRASAVGVYRLWRDAGFAVGALAAGLFADRFGSPAANSGRRGADRTVRTRRDGPNGRNETVDGGRWDRRVTAGAIGSPQGGPS